VRWKQAVNTGHLYERSSEFQRDVSLRARIVSYLLEDFNGILVAWINQLQHIQAVYEFREPELTVCKIGLLLFTDIL
jgi:hypothetical protein